MASWIIISLALVYLALLFGAAYWAEKTDAPIGGSRWVYALAIPVFCTAWTFYGSVGKAVTDGWEFLTIYLGPILGMPLWWLVVRKMIKVCEVQRVFTLPDFLAGRYDKSLSLSVVSSLLLVFGIIPYISIQLKAIVASFEILSREQETAGDTFFLTDSAFYLSILLALFIVFFVFRSIEATNKHRGLMVALAVDSIVKVVAFVAVGIFVSFFLFDGLGDLFSRLTPRDLIPYQQIPENTGFEWFLLLMLSMSAFLLLPRQFQVIVAENQDEDHLRTAIWLIPLYLLLINLFVVPIALAGKAILVDGSDPDAFVLAIPLMQGLDGLALLAFLGGFSAAITMIVVSTTSLSMIVSNNIVVPLLLRRIDDSHTYQSLPLKSRRLAVFFILVLSYLYYQYVADIFSLVSIGLISFVAIFQFFPAVLGALFWKDANKRGALWGLITGFAVWVYTLVIPTLVKAQFLDASILTEGPLGWAWLRPEALFGLEMSPVPHAAFWSFLLNGGVFCVASLTSQQSVKEKNLAEIYCDIWSHEEAQEDKLLWKGELVYQDLIRVSSKLMGPSLSEESLRYYKRLYGEPLDAEGRVESRFVNYIERLLSGTVGSASARMVISSIAKEEELEMDEVLSILKETSEVKRLNHALQEKSSELSQRTVELQLANERLKALDIEKDDFISTVTHELRTPLTSIKAFVEILEDSHDSDPVAAQKFLQIINDEIDRMTRLINEVLDIEKLESGRVDMLAKSIRPREVVEGVIDSFGHLLKSQQIDLTTNFGEAFKDVEIEADPDRMKQVLVNLISNAIKYGKAEHPTIEVVGRVERGQVKIAVRDNGPGIAPANLVRLFEKFFQAGDQTTRKPSGTGLGLAISKRIVEMHGGLLEATSTLQVGSTFTVYLPLRKTIKPQAAIP